MKTLRKFVNSKYFYGILWTVIIIAVWELFATIVQFTKRTPENVLPHISGILQSIFSTQTINGSQTALQMVLENAGATLCNRYRGRLHTRAAYEFERCG